MMNIHHVLNFQQQNTLYEIFWIIKYVKSWKLYSIISK